MKITEELLPGAWVVKLNRFDDVRGSFVKTFAQSVFELEGLQFSFREEFYSLSARDVIRGMHFQTPPYDHVKVVYCPVGAVLDVLLDLRWGANFGKSASVVLDDSEPKLLFIPPGIAHGFRSLKENSLMVYKTSTEHAPSHDSGILWNSFGFDWGVENPVVSARDASHPHFRKFESPF